MKKTSCKGSNYKYLGHFAQDKHLHRGHNTNDWVDASSPIDFKSLSKEQRREFQKQAMEKYGPKDQMSPEYDYEWQNRNPAAAKKLKEEY